MFWSNGLFEIVVGLLILGTVALLGILGTIGAPIDLLVLSITQAKKPSKQFHLSEITK